jgi:hypothetical protein
MILLLVQLAEADVVRSIPIDCPPGSSESMNHTGTWCRPDPTCTDTCEDGKACVAEVGLCVETTTERCGGRASFNEDCSWEKTQAHGLCASDADCLAGSCQVASRCLGPDDQSKLRPATKSLPAELSAEPVEAAVPDAPEPKRCSTTGLASSGLGLLLLLLAGLTRRR